MSTSAYWGERKKSHIMEQCMRFPSIGEKTMNSNRDGMRTETTSKLNNSCRNGLNRKKCRRGREWMMTSLRPDLCAHDAICQAFDAIIWREQVLTNRSGEIADSVRSDANRSHRLFISSSRCSGNSCSRHYFLFNQNALIAQMKKWLSAQWRCVISAIIHLFPMKPVYNFQWLRARIIRLIYQIIDKSIDCGEENTTIFSGPAF